MRLSFLQNADGGWSFRFISKGRIVLHSESYDNKWNAERAAKNFEREFVEASELDKLEVDYQSPLDIERAKKRKTMEGK